MAEKSQRPKGQDGVLSSLNMVANGPNLAGELSSSTPAKAVFGTVLIFLFYDETSRVWGPGTGNE
jgi:hypothetical protein